ncbi:hypothetical protein ElyMa_004528000 [Elysia marginata]|uniref:Uncharacterized protein n=1 Tax=Elysia marginata TaxID=1093978 RepID=A0AAV4HNZ7_9GAST|nr:hypothetical protein ElyMa_004528000 [Elysia marginata]
MANSKMTVFEASQLPTSVARLAGLLVGNFMLIGRSFISSLGSSLLSQSPRCHTRRYGGEHQGMDYRPQARLSPDGPDSPPSSDSDRSSIKEPGVLTQGDRIFQRAQNLKQTTSISVERPTKLVEH